MGRLDHPNVVRVIQFRKRDEVPYLVLEFVQGETLRNRLKRAGAVRHNDALDIMLGICAGLQAAHELGVIHRDVKSDNVLLSKDGKVKLVDFGLAKSTVNVGDQTAAGIIVGTPAYMSPEQCHGGELDGRTDIYSAGVILFQMLTGKVPFEDESTLKVLQHHVSTPPPDLQTVMPFIRPELNELVQRALAKDPADRYRTAAAFSAAIERTKERLLQVKLCDTGPQQTKKRLAEGDETQPVKVPAGPKEHKEKTSFKSTGVVIAVIFLLLFALAGALVPAPKVKNEPITRRPTPTVTKKESGNLQLEQISENKARLIQWRGIEGNEGRELVAFLIEKSRSADVAVSTSAKEAMTSLVLNASPGGLPFEIAAPAAICLAEKGDILASTNLLKWLPRMPATTRIQALSAVAKGCEKRKYSSRPKAEGVVDVCAQALENPPTKHCSAAQRRLIVKLLQEISKTEQEVR